MVLPDLSPHKLSKELHSNKLGRSTVAPLDLTSLIEFYRALLHGMVSSSFNQVRQETLKLDTLWFQTSQVLMFLAGALPSPLCHRGPPAPRRRGRPSDCQ